MNNKKKLHSDFLYFLVFRIVFAHFQLTKQFHNTILPGYNWFIFTHCVVTYSNVLILMTYTYKQRLKNITLDIEIENNYNLITKLTW